MLLTCRHAWTLFQHSKTLFITQQGVVRASNRFTNAAQGSDKDRNVPGLYLLNCARRKIGEFSQLLLR
jgi:hypothetical protein